MADLQRIYAAFSVEDASEMLDKLYGADFTDNEQELLEEELIDQDLSVRELTALLVDEKLRTQPGIFN